MLKPRILIVEDAVDVASLLERGLCEEGFEAKVAPTGESALRLADEPWDLVVLDLMLPDMSGEAVLDYLSQRIDHPPVLVLSARAQLGDKLELFKKGCDDYLTKPFAFEELLGRVRALLRRSPKSIPQEGRYRDMFLVAETFQLFAGEKAVTLTPKEFSICRLLLREPGKIVSRKELIHSVWGLTREPRTNYIEVHLTNLRKKLGQLGRETWLQTVRSAGFLFHCPEGA